MTKLRINYAFFNTSLTGGTRVLFEIVNRLVQRGHHVTVTSLGNEKDHAWFPLKAETNYVGAGRVQKNVEPTLRRLVKFLPSGYTNRARVARLPNQIKALAKAIPDCDINVATYCFSAFSVSESRKGLPFYHMQHYEPYFFDDTRLIKMAEKTYHLPLNKFVNSIWLKKQMEDRYGYDLPIVNPAIDHDVFYPRDVERVSNEFRVMCFAKQAKWKGFPEALEAMKLIAKERADVKFVAFGLEQPSYKSDVPYEFIKAPSDDQLARLYSSVDVIMCPSWYESFPLYPLEAMACGTPIVTTPYGTEDYAVHEKNCLVVPPYDPKRLAEATLKLLEDEELREAFRKEGPVTAKQFTWEKTTDKVEKLFSKAQ
ncbi:glycosyltransferase family 4 protein [Candidatus Bathyarchaeota archaeon A05DMB-2]|jgi:glycosyltransferase involved in cell wall biosynthesis|nr:glycosyltransferase family 4 protein [Candidatus Bathyarchaeota archaeon A05DMB-2]